MSGIQVNSRVIEWLHDEFKNNKDADNLILLVEKLPIMHSLNSDKDSDSSNNMCLFMLQAFMECARGKINGDEKLYAKRWFFFNLMDFIRDLLDDPRFGESNSLYSSLVDSVPRRRRTHR